MPLIKRKNEPKDLTTRNPDATHIYTEKIFDVRNFENHLQRKINMAVNNVRARCIASMNSRLEHQHFHTRRHFGLI